jgi:arylamine N-acetyltransferase
MLESVSGDEAARILMPRLGLGGPDRGVRGASARGVDFLRELAMRFSDLPYENVSKILKAAKAATPADAMRLPTEVAVDHVERNLGGTCFSLTFLFERTLKSFGFDCYKVMADMNSGRNVHCLVVVREGGGKYMIDPGYALYEAIALHPEGAERVSCPHAVVEVVAEAGTGDADAEVADRVSSARPGVAAPGVESDGSAPTYNLWTDDAAGRKWRYRFKDEPVSDETFEGHWIDSFAKPTLNNICITRMTPRGHIYLRKDFFKFTSPTSIEKRRIASGRERFIEQEFGIGAGWVEAAQRLLDSRPKIPGGGRGATWQR